MKKISIFVFMTVCGALYAINPRDINDTSNIRRSSPELRAKLLTNLMQKRLQLDNSGTVNLLHQSNLAYEEKLQKLVIDNPPPKFLSTRKNREDDVFDKLGKDRDKDLNKILGGKYKDYSKQQYMLRNELKNAISADIEANKQREKIRQDSLKQEEARQKAEELAQAQAAYAKKKDKKDKEKDGKKKKKKKKKD